ncbi:MAG: hypothetical protein QOG48_129 [Verrucomicrobiota bacterium]
MRKQSLLLALITVAALAPFLNKAFHIDDPLFIWMAQQVVKHPLDPYGFEVNWATYPQPAFEQIQNPPLCAYYIAAVGAVFGWSEIALHAAFLFWATMSIFGTFVLARRFCDKPFQAALFTLFTPVFLVSATNVMCDVMLLALWLWSIELWLRGLELNKWTLSILSALLIVAAALTKYFGIALVPLLALYTIWRNWRQTWRILFLLLPIIAVIAYDLWTKSKYGRGLFSDAAFYAQNIGARSTSTFAAQFLTGLAFLGGSIALSLFYLPLRSRAQLLITLAISVATFAGCWFLLPMNPDWHLGANELLVRFEAALFATIGANILTWVIVDLAQRRSAKRILLAAWLVGTFVFATFLNWSITARTFLPLAPVAAILFVRRISTAWLLLPAAIISFAVAFADFKQANSARSTAKHFQKQFRDQRVTAWFQSHWGFQYYMQQWGAKPFDARDVRAESGDVMIVPANNTAVTPIPPDKIFPPEEQTSEVLPFVSTMGLQTGASFYSSVRGPLPWAVDQVPPEKYYVARFR